MVIRTHVNCSPAVLPFAALDEDVVQDQNDGEIIRVQFCKGKNLLELHCFTSKLHVLVSLKYFLDVPANLPSDLV